MDLFLFIYFSRYATSTKMIFWAKAEYFLMIMWVNMKSLILGNNKMIRSDSWFCRMPVKVTDSRTVKHFEHLNISKRTFVIQFLPLPVVECRSHSSSTHCKRIEPSNRDFKNWFITYWILKKLIERTFPNNFFILTIIIIFIYLFTEKLGWLN